MSKTIILEISGDDYAATIIEDGMGIQKAYELAKENGGTYETDVYATITIHEFGVVDENFVTFARNFIGYDVSKTNNFYLIKYVE